MPYIKEQEKPGVINTLCPDTAGQLNYLLTYIVCNYAFLHPGYQGINDVVGALEGCKLEFYRRYVAPYEDIKIQQNGDVY